MRKMLIVICLVVVTAAAGLYIGTHPVVKNAYYSYREAHPTRKMIAERVEAERILAEQEAETARLLIEQEQRIIHYKHLIDFRLLLDRKGFPGFSEREITNKDLEEIAEITGWVFGGDNTVWPYWVSANGDIYDKNGVCVWPKESPMS